MIDVVKYGEFKPTGKQKKKKQIILSHTSRDVKNYLMSLKYRYNGKYDKVPNYIVNREGKILKLLNDNEHSNYFSEPNINRNSIIVCLENLGWLEKEPLKNSHINWIGNIYKEKIYEKKWRDYFFWQPYTEIQIEKTAELCNHLMNELSITKECIGHNTKINGVERYEGIVTKSNFDSEFTDVSPAFNFEQFIKLIENE
jgi:N-acetyl-anhydromuramyl-L-alanine amidase AmpD